MPRGEGRLRVAVAGAAGRMGKETCRTILASPDFELVLAVDRSGGGPLGDILGVDSHGLMLEGKLGEGLDRVGADVLVEFTSASAAPVHAEMALKRGIAPVIGATGLDKDTLRSLAALSKEHGTPGMYVPNFAIGAVLMMKFSEMAARWLPDAEIVEMHHDRKEDAPSGTSMRTAEMIASARKQPPTPKPRAAIKVEGVRGGAHHEVPIHSVRLPGLLAHQQVMFGGQGEVLTIRHDSLDRGSFMEGVKLCVSKVWDLDGFVIGMDRLLFE
ncbi:MAG: 4-hydroxy-tetrahydrodipicolinate reductase [Fimbriimonadaceae bacterium]